VKSLIAWELDAPVKVAIAVLGLALFVFMLYWASVRDAVDAGECRSLYQRAQTAAESSAVDAQGAGAKVPGMSCGDLRRAGRIR